MRRSKKYSRPVRPLNVRAAMGGVKHEVGRDGAEYKVFHISEAAKRCAPDAEARSTSARRTRWRGRKTPS